MKLISISLGSWLLGLSAILLTFFVVEGDSLSAADIKGATDHLSRSSPHCFSRSLMLHLCSGCANAWAAAAPLRFSRSPPPSCSIFRFF